MNQEFKLPFLASIICVFGMLVGMRLQDSLHHDGYLQKQSPSPEMAIFEASEHIRHKYYGERPIEKYTDAVISGMIDQLDPYSHYFQEDKSLKYDQYVNGLFRGLGIEFVEYGDSVFVATVIEESPAAKSGIEIGDVLLTYDSLDLTHPGVNLDSIKRIPEKQLGTQVTLGLYKKKTSGSERMFQTELEISDIQLPLIENYVLSSIVDAKSRSMDSVSYFRIKRFYKGVYRDFMEAVESHRRDHGLGSSIIIDLRDNPGGIVEETIKLLDQMIREKNQLLLSTISKVDITKEYYSSGRSFLNTERIVILCNENSASASEILAGVLQDYDKAVILGQQTFGKGLIQQNYDLANHGSINISIGEYILPSGRHINPASAIDSSYESLVNKRNLYSDRGVSPDITLKPCNEDKMKSIEFKLMAHFDIWSLDDYDRSDLGTLNTLLESWQVEQSCQTDLYTSTRWLLAKATTSLGGVVNISNTDITMQRAFEIITGEEYDELLGN